RLKNPLREICTVGSVRGEIPDEPWWTYTGTKPETADTAKGSLKLTGTPLLGNGGKGNCSNRLSPHALGPR
ncbi:MAG: hypothetical protein WA741_21095, partial [Candidatus Sulfotelmatobacter sp.]